MQNINIFESALEYIDKNLKTTISTDELADMAGYSVWHYCRMFLQATGMTVGRYICKRRLDMALAEISNGCKAIDIVLEYGFDTYAGFYKAFVRMYGCSPKKYLSIYGMHQPNKVKRLRGFNMINENELRDVLTNWDVPQDLPLSDILINDGAIVSGNVWSFGDGYILKAGKRENLLKNIRVEKALAVQGFTTGIPLTTKRGVDYFDNGEHIYTLTCKIQGEPLPKIDRFGDESYKFSIKYGKSIAKLHRALINIEADIMPDEANLYKMVIKWAMPNIRKQNEQWNMGLPESFFKDYTETFGKIFDKLPKQLIHRDIHPSNILFYNGEVSGFIDFDLSERNIRLWDPCYCSTGILCEWSDVDNIHDKWPLILNGILHGYDSVNSFTDEEKQAVFYVLCSIQMICVAYFESIDEYKELAKTNREMLQYIVQNKTRITDNF